LAWDILKVNFQTLNLNLAHTQPVEVTHRSQGIQTICPGSLHVGKGAAATTTTSHQVTDSETEPDSDVDFSTVSNKPGVAIAAEEDSETEDDIDDVPNTELVRPS
jgi:hypothetical protein